ncbi:MAG: hypothetical protein QF441_14665 [Bacteriovoracaceae bacterium]|nr:hypothetical protein [Bacteriovoracaceae bacterium]
MNFKLALLAFLFLLLTSCGLKTYPKPKKPGLSPSLIEQYSKTLKKKKSKEEKQQQ